MTIKQLPAQIAHKTKENSPLLLTIAGVAGLAATAYLTGSATVKAIRIIDGEENVGGVADDVQERFKERFRWTWKLYIPAVSTGVLTASCIVGANRIGARRAASVAAAFSLSERTINEYKHKVVEKIGEKAEGEIREELSIDRARRTEIPEAYVVGEDGMLGLPGTVLCFDEYTSRYFISDMESIKKAVNDVNYQINHHMYASLTDFYNRVGLPSTSFSDDVGWNSNQLVEISFTSQIAESGQPCLAFDFVNRPVIYYTSNR